MLGVMTRMLVFTFTTSSGHAPGNMQKSRLPREGFVVFVFVFALNRISTLLRHPAHPHSVLVLPREMQVPWSHRQNRQGEEKNYPVAAKTKKQQTSNEKWDLCTSEKEQHSVITPTRNKLTRHA